MISKSMLVYDKQDHVCLYDKQPMLVYDKQEHVCLYDKQEHACL